MCCYRSPEKTTNTIQLFVQETNHMFSRDVIKGPTVSGRFQYMVQTRFPQERASVSATVVRRLSQR